MNPSGNVYYIDSYNQQYKVEWVSRDNLIDLTTTIMQPYVWGEKPEGKIENNNVYVKGIISISRQIISNDQDGYTILADGSAQYIDYIRTTFNCHALPVDQFKYHYDSDVSEHITIPVSGGPGWYDIDDISTSTDACVWANLDASGFPIGSDVFFEFVDVWS